MTEVPASPPILQVENLTKFFGGLAAVREVSFEVAAGQIYGIIGPNGAGKTTLFSLIAGAFRPTSGTVRARGHDITSLRPFQRVQVGIARTHQVVRPFRAMSVLENVQVAAYFGRRKSNAKEHAIKVLCAVGIEKLANDPAYVLSVGNQKKLEVARALAAGPDLLLCDEICGGLTHAETASMLQLLREIRDRGTTVMYVEHDVKAITAICDRIMVLNYGRKLSEGSPAEIQFDPAVIEAYLGVPPEERFNA